MKKGHSLQAHFFIPIPGKKFGVSLLQPDYPSSVAINYAEHDHGSKKFFRLWRACSCMRTLIFLCFEHLLVSIIKLLSSHYLRLVALNFEWVFIWPLIIGGASYDAFLWLYNGSSNTIDVFPPLLEIRLGSVFVTLLVDAVWCSLILSLA